MEVTFKPSVKQFTAWEYLTDQTTTEIGYGGAASGGKSYLECVFLTTMCLAYPDTGWMLGRKELTNLKRTTLLTLFKVFSDFGMDEKSYSYNQQNNIITFPNKSQIFLFDLGYKPSDPLYTRLGGLELTGGAIDESNEVPAEAINIVKTRIGRRNNEKHNLKPKLLETFNPDKGHVYYRYYKPWKDGTLPAHRRFVFALPGDNPYTSEAYMEQLRQSDRVTRERLLLGNFDYDDDPTTMIRVDAVSDLKTNAVSTEGGYLSVDVARFGRDKTVIGLWHGLKMERATILEKAGTDVVASTVKQIAFDNQVPFSQIIVDEDGVGGGVIDQLGGVVGFLNNSRPFEVWDSRTYKFVASNYSNLKTQCYFKLAELINSHKMAVADDSIRDVMTQDLSAIKQRNMDSDGKLQIISKEEMKELLGRSPDVADMLMMRMFFEFRRPEGQAVQERMARNHIEARRNISISRR
jgi:phage terminase large subunit